MFLFAKLLLFSKITKFYIKFFFTTHFYLLFAGNKFSIRWKKNKPS